MANNITLKPIKDLLGMNFFIPSYQRGYRWKQRQINQLLDDIYNFTPTEKQPFYFLQALVLSKDGEKWNFVDGQQRLTTISLILNNNENWISYAREANQIIDRYYKDQAEKVIASFLGQPDDEKRKSFCEKIKERCRFLIYTVPKVNELSTFNELNNGKIPAKDSELVKCILLSLGLDEKRVVTQARANEWDDIERQFNDERFFAWMTPKNAWRDSDRMTILFRYAGFEANQNSDEVFPFLKTIQDEVKKSSRETVWRAISSAYYRLLEWYKGPLMYHAVGWWAHRKEHNEIECILKFRKEIVATLEKAIYEPTEDDYNSGQNIKLYHYLLLSNMAYCWKRWPEKYDFLQHRGIGAWSLEHIFARNQRDLKEDELQKWIPKITNEQIADYQTYCKKGNGNLWLSEHIDKNKYPEGEDNSIKNLAMLPKDANSSLNNNLFEGKRTLIVSWSNNFWADYWAPPVTVAIFQKSLPGLSLDRFWSDNDKDAYIDWMSKETTRFIDAVKSFFNYKK